MTELYDLPADDLLTWLKAERRQQVEAERQWSAGEVDALTFRRRHRAARLMQQLLEEVLRMQSHNRAHPADPVGAENRTYRALRRWAAEAVEQASAWEGLEGELRDLLA